MGFEITGTPQAVLKIAANMDDVERDEKDKTAVEKKEKDSKDA